MYKPSRKKKFGKALGTIFASGFLLIFLVHLFYSGFPEKTNKINANILTVEGFPPAQALEKVKDEFQQSGYDKLIITGLNFPGNYYQVSMNGYLIFYPKFMPTRNQADEIHTIEVNAFSELGCGERAHFNFFVNDSLFADFFARKREKKYGI